MDTANGGHRHSEQWTVDSGHRHSGHSAQWKQRTADTVDSGHSERSEQWTQWTVDTAHSELYFAVFNNRVSIAQTVLFDTTSVVKITVPSVFTI